MSAPALLLPEALRLDAASAWAAYERAMADLDECMSRSDAFHIDLFSCALRRAHEIAARRRLPDSNYILMHPVTYTASMMKESLPTTPAVARIVMEDRLLWKEAFGVQTAKVRHSDLQGDAVYDDYVNMCFVSIATDETA